MFGVEEINPPLGLSQTQSCFADSASVLQVGGPVPSIHKRSASWGGAGRRRNSQSPSPVQATPWAPPAQVLEVLSRSPQLPSTVFPQKVCFASLLSVTLKRVGKSQPG